MGTFAGRGFNRKTRTGGSRYTTPVRLRAIARNVWSGNVTPLEDRLSLYLWIGRRGGRLRAFFRNPERNLGMGRSFTVAASGSTVTLTNVDDASDTIVATYDGRSGALSVAIPDFGPFVFTRRTRDTAVGFYPRTPGSVPYTYRAPIVENDGWQTASLAQAGLSGFDGDRTHDMRSASKSITSVLAGIAMDRGAAFSTDSPVAALLNYPSLANPDPRKARITVGDVLSMQSGFACDDNDRNSPGNEDRMYAQSLQLDYYKFALDLPIRRTATGTAGISSRRASEIARTTNTWRKAMAGSSSS
jgi:hypothetical protein